MSEGLYLFCLARASLLEPLRVTGLDGRRPVELAKFKDLAALWCPVELEEFCGPEAATRLENLAWLGPRACRHEKVVEQAMRLSPVLPARFGAIFSSPEKLVLFLQQHYGTICGFLDRVQDSAEWALKGLVNRTRAQEAFLSQRLVREADCLAPLSPGKRYFATQRLRAQAIRELSAWLRQLTANLKGQLQGSGLELRERPVFSPGGREDYPEAVFSWAVLVPQPRLEGFKNWVEAVRAQIGSRALIMECTGPWPPYSFSPSLSLEAS